LGTTLGNKLNILGNKARWGLPLESARIFVNLEKCDFRKFFSVLSEHYFSTIILYFSRNLHKKFKIENGRLRNHFVISPPAFLGANLTCL
jgi:hypothetical protein